MYMYIAGWISYRDEGPTTLAVAASVELRWWEGKGKEEGEGGDREEGSHVLSGSASG